MEQGPATFSGYHHRLNPPKSNAVTQRYTLSIARDRKIVTHSVSYHSVGVSFIPMVLQFLGGW